MWFVVALIVGTALTALVLWLRSKTIVVKWYEWLIGVIGLLLLLFAFQNLVGTIGELYPQPAWMLLLILGLPALILMVVAWQLVARRQRSAG